MKLATIVVAALLLLAVCSSALQVEFKFQRDVYDATKDEILTDHTLPYGSTYQVFVGSYSGEANMLNGQAAGFTNSESTAVVTQYWNASQNKLVDLEAGKSYIMVFGKKISTTEYYQSIEYPFYVSADAKQTVTVDATETYKLSAIVLDGVAYGQAIYVTGDSYKLGSWRDAFILSYKGYSWEIILQLPDGLRYQFIKATDKFVPLSVLHPSVQWEDLAAGVVNKIGDFCFEKPNFRRYDTTSVPCVNHEARFKDAVGKSYYYARVNLYKTYFSNNQFVKRLTTSDGGYPYNVYLGGAAIAGGLPANSFFGSDLVWQTLDIQNSKMVPLTAGKTYELRVGRWLSHYTYFQTSEALSLTAPTLIGETNAAVVNVSLDPLYTFKITSDVGFGWSVYITGNSTLLGDWKAGYKMTWSAGNVWTLTLRLPDTVGLVYKYFNNAIATPCATHTVQWDSNGQEL